jgi:hypothetical protein
MSRTVRLTGQASGDEDIAGCMLLTSGAQSFVIVIEQLSIFSQLTCVKGCQMVKRE